MSTRCTEPVRLNLTVRFNLDRLTALFNEPFFCYAFSMSVCTPFKDKRIIVMGLGLLGRGVGVTKFLAECGAKLLVTDLKSAEQLAESLEKLKEFKDIEYHLGGHRLEDFGKHGFGDRPADMVIKAAGVPLDSPFIEEARKNGIPVKMDASLFVELMPRDVTTIGVTGTRGKTTTTQIIYEILKTWLGTENKERTRKVFLGGNIRNLATLPLLHEVHSGDIVVLELDSWQLQGFDESKISPDIAVFTTFFPDHLNYYRNEIDKYWKDKATIFRHQTKDQFFVVTTQVANEMIERGDSAHAKTEIVNAETLPKDWNLLVLGVHNRENAAVALTVVRNLGVPDEISKKMLENFKGVEGRLQFVRDHKGIKYYNDTTATSPEGAMAALRSLDDRKGRIVHLAGGADKGLHYEELGAIIPEYDKALILFKGEATEKIKSVLFGHVNKVIEVGSMQEAFLHVDEIAREGDVVLLSPGAASFGIFKNEYDRGDQFVTRVNALI